MDALYYICMALFCCDVIGRSMYHLKTKGLKDLHIMLMCVCVCIMSRIANQKITTDQKMNFLKNVLNHQLWLLLRVNCDFQLIVFNFGVIVFNC